MEGVQAARGEEAGHRHPAALDEEPPDPAGAQGGEHGARLEPALCRGKPQDLGRPQPVAVLAIGPAEEERGRVGFAEDVAIGAEPAVRVEHDPQRVRAGHEADGEAGIVGHDRAGAHEHRVGERTQPVHVDEVLGAGDEARMAGLGRNPAIEALAEMGHDHEPVGGGGEEVAVGREEASSVGVEPVERHGRQITRAVGAGQEPLPGARHAVGRRFRAAHRRAPGGRHSRIASSSIWIGISSATQPFSTA
jgi:hypothetical protein